MELRKLLLCAGVLALLLSCTPFALAEDVVKDQVRCSTTWDDSYLYIACRVDCPDVQGIQKKPNADISGDDGIEIYFESDNEHSSKITPACYAMAVSVAGGCQFRVGDQAGAFQPTPAYTYKYGVTVQGTMNNSDDADMSYTIEAAVPWHLIKRNPPSMGDMISFNLIVRRHGQNGGFVSMAPQVKTEQDTLNPAKWANIVFTAHAFGATTLNLDKIVSPKYVVRPPLVDGVVGDREYSRSSAFSIDLPMPSGGGYEAKYPTQRLVFAKYSYNYQLDPRKEAPVYPQSRKDGSISFENFPAKNAGPWLSYDRVQWHKEELTDMDSAGIDVVMPVYEGSKQARAAYSVKGLDCLVSALEELRSEGKSYPLVAMYLDADSIAQAYGDQKPDLKSDEVKRSLYGMIKDFFDRVPVDFRAFAQTGKPNPGRLGPIVLLYVSGEGPFSDIDSSFINYCNDRFERDFGSPLIWAARGGIAAKAKGFDAITNMGAGFFDNSARISTGSVTPGYDYSATAESGDSALLSRLDGVTYQKGWDEVAARSPQWVFCDGWDQFDSAAGISATRQYGRKYIDATRANISRFRGGRDYSAQYSWVNAAKVLPQKQISLAEITIKNVGQAPWKASDGYALSYRWYKGGRFFGESKVRRPIDKDVLPGDSITVNIGVATITALGTDIPEGSCELRFEMVHNSDNKWFSAYGDQPFMVPVIIAQPKEWDATYLSCAVPAMLASGQSYPASVQVRNDGTQTWVRGVTRLTCKLYKTTNYTHDNPVESATEVPIQKVEGILVKDCKPGEIATFSLRFNLVGADKQPIPSWKQDDPWSYQLRFDITNGEKQLSELGARTLNKVVDIFDADFGPRIVDSDVPNKLAAGQQFEAKVIVRNGGAQVWDRKRVKVGYHWYHLDGTEMRWDNTAVPIPANLQPGWPLVVRATVNTPEYDGQYVLVWDVMMDDKWLSTSPLTRGGDILPMFVEVTNGRLAFVDLSPAFDTCAMSPDTECTIGNFDGKGFSFPEELMPPDIGVSTDISHIYPVGYQWDRENRPDGRISFYYPDNTPGSKNAVICNGQSANVESGSYTAAYILGASTNGTASGEVVLDYATEAQSIPIQMADWTSAPTPDAVVGYATRHRHSPTGDEKGKACYLYTYKLALDASRTLKGITLPRNPDMKIMAITLERAEQPMQPAHPEAKVKEKSTEKASAK